MQWWRLQSAVYFAFTSLLSLALTVELDERRMERERKKKLCGLTGKKERLLCIGQRRNETTGVCELRRREWRQVRQDRACWFASLCVDHYLISLLVVLQTWLVGRQLLTFPHPVERRSILGRPTHLGSVAPAELSKQRAGRLALAADVWDNRVRRWRAAASVSATLTSSVAGNHAPPPPRLTRRIFFAAGVGWPDVGQLAPYPSRRRPVATVSSRSRHQGCFYHGVGEFYPYTKWSLPPWSSRTVGRGVKLYIW